MAKVNKQAKYYKKLPDYLTMELVFALKDEESFSFNSLFELVHNNLRKKRSVSGGEEMLRLRTYEKLQGLMKQGLVSKENRIFQGTDKITNFIKEQEELIAESEKNKAI